MATDLIDKLAETAADQQEALEVAYRDLRDRAVRGGESDPDDALQILGARGMSLADFETDCARYSQRLELAERLKAEPDLTAKYEKVKAEIASFEAGQKADWDAAQKKIAAKKAARDELVGKLGSIKSCKRELIQTCDPRFQQQEQALRARLSELGQARQVLGHEIASFKDQLVVARHRAEHINKSGRDEFAQTADSRDWAKRTAEGLQTEIARLEANETALAGQCEALLAELERLDSLKLEP